MTNDELRRKMEFIVEQQAQFAASIQRMEEERVRDRPRLARVEESFVVLVQLAQNSDSRIDAIETRVNLVETTMVKLQANMAILAESQAHSDARLSALIDIVREDRNGRS